MNAKLGSPEVLSSSTSDAFAYLSLCLSSISVNQIYIGRTDC